MPASPKHPSALSRARDARRRSRGLRVLTGRGGDAPSWPLGPDTARSAELETLRDKVARLQLEIENATDGRTKARLTRQREQNELATAKLTLELEQASDAENALWSELWSFPQAELWEENKSHRSVALFVRLQIRAEQGDLRAATEARQWSDRLGLNDLALLRLRAEAERVDEAERKGDRRRAARPPANEQKPQTVDPRRLLYGLD